nr:metalloproteinase inhibitor 3-like [Cherax quadricarinatus]
MGVLWCVSLVVLVVMVVPPAAPCSCLRKHPQQHVCDADYVVFARVRRLTTTPNGILAYKVKVKKIIKASEKVEMILQKGLIYTPSSPSMCEAELKTRTSHVLTGSVHDGKPWIDLCNFAAPIRSLTPKMKKGFRLLYQSGCDCPIMSCHHWERCPKANFFCAWETSLEKNDCQGRQSICLRGPNGTCDWLRGRHYWTCMKTLRAKANATNTDSNNTQDNSISIDIPGHHKPLRYGYKRNRGYRTRPLQPVRPHNAYSRIGYVHKNG